MTRNDSSQPILIGGIVLAHNKHTPSHGMGMLPAKAPLANPYVPFQEKDPAMYDPRKGMIRGTIYPGLDLPFMGMVNKTEKPATAMAFTLTPHSSEWSRTIFIALERSQSELGNTASSLREYLSTKV